MSTAEVPMEYDWEVIGEFVNEAGDETSAATVNADILTIVDGHLIFLGRCPSGNVVVRAIPSGEWRDVVWLGRYSP